MFLTIAKIIIAALALLLVFCIGYYCGTRNEHRMLLKAIKTIQAEKEKKDETVS